MSVEIHWRGQVQSLDRFPDGATRLAFIASLLTTNEMRRLFIGDDAHDVCHQLKIETKSRDSEGTLCRKIWEHYHESS